MEHAAALVAPCHELKEEVRAAPCERQMAELLDEEQLRLAVKQQAIGELPFGFCFGEGREQRGRVREEHGVAGFDDRAAQRDGEVRLAHTGRSEEQHVFGLGEESAGGELANEAPIGRRLEFEIEVVQLCWSRGRQRGGVFGARRTT